MGTNITGIGNANAIGFKSRVTGGMYFPPELKDALVGVWSAYGKSNDSTDRNIIKNKIKDRGGDFELINFNYEGTSGYNGYPVVFGKDKTYQYVNHSPNYNQTTINVTHFNTRQALLYSYIQRNGELTSYNRDYPSYKIKVSGLEEGFGLMYQYNSKADATSVNALRIETNGIYTIPKSFASDGSLTNANIWVGFVFTGTEQEQCNVTIEVLPEYKGAVVTDGVDDMIVSQNTVEEMGITDKFTVVSMIHQITLRGATAAALTNYIRQPIGHEYVRNHVANIGKTGIYGYAVYDVNHSSAINSHIINTILGDKNDYSIYIIGNLSQGKFSVQGYISGDNNAVELSRVAWYWTFIANKVLTEDEINLVIEKYNLDRPGEIVKPQVYYNVKKQKITNENHSAFDDKLTDFSGNGYDAKLYNFSWEGNSGIGDYPIIFGANKTWNQMPLYNFVYSSNNSNKLHITKALVAGNGLLFSYVKQNDILLNVKEIPSFKIKISGLEGKSKLWYRYLKTENASNETILSLDNGIHELPKSFAPTDSVYNNVWIGFTITPIAEGIREFDCDIIIEVIPSNENALCFDGVNDFGKVTGMPTYKDYTVVADYERLKINIGVDSDSPILSKSESVKLGAFIFNTISSNGDKVSYSFGRRNIINTDDTIRKIFYQSKYINDGQDINIESTFVDSDKLWLGTYRDSDYRFIAAAIYSLMSFPYSMSEFLIERQLKKHKLGTLYPDMVEFRPVINSNVKWDTIEIWQGDKSLYRPTINDNKTGIYLKKDSTIGIYVKPKDADEVTKIVVNGTEYTNLKINSNGFYYVTLPITKSPQKINITIDEYIRYEDIVQPYPVVVGLGANSWGSKLKVGSTISYIGMVNLLAGLYEIRGTLLFNGTPFNKNSGLHKIEKNNVFSFSDSFKYLLDNNEPKVILSPSRLRIPNSSYKYLGYIPDISGNGNNGTFTNFAFSGMSGANGYSYDYKDTSKFVCHALSATLVNSETVKFINVLTQTSFYYKGTNYKGKIKVTGITRAIASGKVRYLDIYSNSPTNNDRVIIDKDGIYDVNIETEDAINIFFYLTPMVSGTTALDEPVYLEQVGNYEGSICFDGVDDYIKIDTNGGMTMLMKANVMSTVDKILYDQRNSSLSGQFAIMTSNSDSLLAYDGRNATGKTYINGILNANITCGQLLNITHNITALAGDSTSLGKGGVIIGASKELASYCMAAVFDFMLFDNISTDDKIKELNEYVGIEGDFYEMDFNNDFLIGN